MTIVSFPVLTVAALEGDAWEPALTLPLPPRPSFELLDLAGQRILDYLVWVTQDLAQTDADRAVREIRRAADRLIEIAAATPASLSATLDADAKRFQAEANLDRDRPE
jgi:hypothetical protein